MVGFDASFHGLACMIGGAPSVAFRCRFQSSLVSLTLVVLSFRDSDGSWRSATRLSAHAARYVIADQFTSGGTPAS